MDAEGTPSWDRTVVGGFSGRERRVNSMVDDAVATLRSGFDAIRAPPPLKSGDVAFAFEMSWIERITAAPSELVSSRIAADEGEDSAAAAAAGREELEADEGERKKGQRCGICLAGAATLGTERACAESKPVPVMSDPSAAPRGSSMPYRAPVTAATFSGGGAAFAGPAAAAEEETLTAGSESTDGAREDEVEEDNRIRRRAAAARGLEEPAIPPAPCVFATAVVGAATFANLCAPRPLSCSVPRMNGFLVAHCPLPSTIPARFNALPCPSSRLFHRQGTWRTAPPCRDMALSCERAERRSEGWTAPSDAEAR